MYKLIAVGATALFVAASAPAFAQGGDTGINPMNYMYPTGQAGEGVHLSALDWKTLTNARIKIVQAALQLTSQQEKFWPAVEQAIRTRAEHRQSRIARAAEAMATAEKGKGAFLKNLSERDPAKFMQARAHALSQRSEDLKKLADAWQPLYQTLKPEQKQRLAVLTVTVLHGMGNRLERRILESQEESEQ